MTSLGLKMFRPRAARAFEANPHNKVLTKEEEAELRHEEELKDGDPDEKNAMDGIIAKQMEELRRLQSRQKRRSQNVAEKKIRERRAELDNRLVEARLADDEEMPDWEDLPHDDKKQPPKALMITNVKHSQDLLRVASTETSSANNQSSEEWIKVHGMDALSLTVEHLLNSGEVTRNMSSSTGQPQQQLQFNPGYVGHFEKRVHTAIGDMHSRIKWLMNGSKRCFGVVKGLNICVIIDMSAVNLQTGRRKDFKDALLMLVTEQLSMKRSIFPIGVGTDAHPLFNQPREVTYHTLQELRHWVQDCEPRGGNNLLAALRIAFATKGIDSIVVVMGSSPDQSHEILCSMVQECLAGRSLTVQTVSYESTNHLTNVTMRNVADVSAGRFHLYNSADTRQIHSGTDITDLLTEIRKGQQVLAKIQEMRQGLMSDALGEIMTEIAEEVSKLPASRFLPRPPYHTGPLKVHEPKFEAKSSREWLRNNGLKAKRLNLYQVLAPNAYDYVEGFVPVIEKTVRSTNLETSMVQFRWHDATVKNVHVDAAMLYDYQKSLGELVELYEKRVDWLSLGSRRLWGNVVERKVCILIDCSQQNAAYIIHIQHSLRLLLEQQMANKVKFNVIAFGSTARCWKSEGVVPTPGNLQSAWSWILGLDCSGGRNFLQAFRMATECHSKYDGIYLFTSGIADHLPDVLTSFVNEKCTYSNTRLQIILFSIDDYVQVGPLPGRYANSSETADMLRNVAHAGRGRFHWFRETGVVESDDISLIVDEMDRAVNFSKKCSMLVSLLKRKSKARVESSVVPATLVRHTEPKRQVSLALPRPNRTSELRKKSHLEDEKPASAATHWRVASKRSTIPDLQKRPISAPPKKGASSKEAFYLDGNGTMRGKGECFQKYPTVLEKKPRVRKSIVKAKIPKEETVATTAAWLKKYGLTKLGLNLGKLVSGPDCKHQKVKVKSLGKVVQAKYCSIFPSVEVNGSVKHLQLTVGELESYVKQIEVVLRRYAARLQWLLAGSHRTFGTIVEKKVAILVDTSGSMDLYLEALKRELAALIWDQLQKGGVQFNLVDFSDNLRRWQDSLMSPTDQNCQDAVNWFAGFTATGGTCTLDALKVALTDDEVDGIYLLTDGKPDTSCSLVLTEVKQLEAQCGGPMKPIHCISFNCHDDLANTFLRQLSAQTGGRFHRLLDREDHTLQQFSHILMHSSQPLEEITAPVAESQDINRLLAEIRQAQTFLSQARSFKKLALETAQASRLQKEVERPDGQKEPEFKMKLSDTIVREGTKLCFAVKVDGNPKPRVTWLHEDVAIDAGLEHKCIYHKDNYHSLLIKGVVREDEGRYMAMAENKVGVCVSVATLRVEKWADLTRIVMEDDISTF